VDKTKLLVRDRLVDRKSSQFGGFPDISLLDVAHRLPLEELDKLCINEGHSSRPIHRVHKWFARRLNTQIRTILTALTLQPEEDDRFWERYHEKLPFDGLRVLDPFAGGGTILLEASRNGADVIGYDIDPMAAAISRFALSAKNKLSHINAARERCLSVSEIIEPFHKTVYKGREVTVLHHFWVEITTCPKCGHRFELHPHYQLARDKGKGVQWAFCKHTHEIQKLDLDRVELWAEDGRRTRIKEGTQKGHNAVCPECGYKRRLGESDSERPPEWQLFAQEVLIEDENGWRGYSRK